ncbi:hypothetical protein [Mucilaginibacter sp.]|uniref:hypothetical protein n=1 Tax=Mucilaginibacter sp. TaxID=1882438 RepID=UPI00262FF742|nr:hypothetical protein [Mucilaginibacter sp.]MDB4925930.1 hypothetical protein [Mucilaginibacter sp.]
MEKLIIPFLLSGLILAIGVNSASAQVQLKEVTISGGATKIEVSKKVSESFASLFKGAEAPIWFQADKNYLVDFILNNQVNKALFTKNGKLVYHMAFGNEKQMPADIRTIVKSKYFDFAITSTLKIDFREKSAWIVNVEDAEQFFVLRVVDGVMDVLDKIKKQESAN